MELALNGPCTSFKMLTGICDMLPVVSSHLHGGKTSL